MHRCNSNDKFRVQTVCINYAFERQIKVPLNLIFLQRSKDKTLAQCRTFPENWLRKQKKKQISISNHLKYQYFTCIRTAFPI